MKTLLLMRHAKSSWGNPSLSDHDRPLNKRGEKACRTMGTFLSQQNRVPDKIICSTAKRARETVTGLLETLSIECEIVYTRALYLADVDTMLEQLHPLSIEFRVVMLVGHNPGMDEFLEVICNEPEHMPTAAIAEIRFNISSWQELTANTPAKLNNLWKPREIQA